MNCPLLNDLAIKAVVWFVEHYTRSLAYVLIFPSLSIYLYCWAPEFASCGHLKARVCRVLGCFSALDIRLDSAKRHGSSKGRYCVILIFTIQLGFVYL